MAKPRSSRREEALFSFDLKLPLESVELVLPRQKIPLLGRIGRAVKRVVRWKSLFLLEFSSSFEENILLAHSLLNSFSMKSCIINALFCEMSDGTAALTLDPSPSPTPLPSSAFGTFSRPARRREATGGGNPITLINPVTINQPPVIQHSTLTTYPSAYE